MTPPNAPDEEAGPEERAAREARVKLITVVKAAVAGIKDAREAIPRATPSDPKDSPKYLNDLWAGLSRCQGALAGLESSQAELMRCAKAVSVGQQARKARLQEKIAKIRERIRALQENTGLSEQTRTQLIAAEKSNEASLQAIRDGIPTPDIEEMMRIHLRRCAELRVTIENKIMTVQEAIRAKIAGPNLKPISEETIRLAEAASDSISRLDIDLSKVLE